MPQGFWTWSKTAASNANSDASINWAEGMPPAQVNDSGRAMMARTAEYRDDTSGLLVTTGTSTAYAVTTNQGLPSTPNDGQLIVVTFHTANGANPTLAADGGTAFPIQLTPANPVFASTIQTNMPVPLKFRAASSAWIMMGAGVAAFAEALAPGIVANSNLANAAAWTLKGNNTSSTGAPTDFTIDSLALKGTPVGADEVPIWDVAGAAMKKATLSTAIAALALRGYIGGLTLSGGGSQTLTINAGVATSDDNTTFMALGSNYTKTFASWVVGSGNGGLDTGSIALNSWYHVFVIERTDTGVVDVLISLSPTTPTLPANYTKQRRIGSIRTDATPNIVPFLQVGDSFYKAASLDYNSASTQALTLTTFTVPTGVVIQPLLFSHFVQSAASGTSDFTVTMAPGANSALSFNARQFGYGQVTSTAYTDDANFFGPPTNTSAQIFVGVAASGVGLTTGQISSYGWIDTRGRFN